MAQARRRRLDMYMTQSFRRAVQLGGDRTATIDGDERRSWREVDWRVRRLAGALAKLGVRKGDRVALLAMNSGRYLEVYFACFWLGAVCVPLNTRWTIDELSYGLADSEPSVLLADSNLRDRAIVLRERDGLTIPIVEVSAQPSPDETLLNYEQLIEAAAPIEAETLDGNAMALICYTGGTTGKSKGVMLSHLAVWTSAFAIGHEVHELSDESTIFLVVMPLFHIGGVQALFASVIGAGCNAFLGSFDPTRFLETVQRERVTHTVLVPTMVRMLLDLPNLEAYDISSMKVLTYGAAPMSQAQIEETMRRFPGLQLQQGYGQTELAPYISTLKPSDHQPGSPHAIRMRSAGKAGICCEIIVADPSGNEVPRGTHGEILVRGPNVMLGYWRKPEETAKTIVNGWVRTGDAAYMDEDGFVFITDRLKDMIVSGGENIYSSEVENTLATHPAVATGVVIGIPHERWGEAVHAIVVLRAGHEVTEQELIDHCRKHIAGYKCPRSVEFRTEPLPVTGPGKILKRELRRPYWEGRGSAVI
ncbi:class I adenylate-forming enzyme family protein [Mesorhizobium sp. ANAO-SY3R2]|uniref:class I adenylate-forming enzyme family protein n=1 Tax=Mesorhizobium sp. ANAO-SY3R2 TaxID=3166644 RepID=UPI00366AE2D1